jgi:alkanesulfonate monooxygenase
MTASSTGSVARTARSGRGRWIPLYFGGASDAAVGVGAEHADVYMLWGEPVAQLAGRIARIRAAAARHDRSVRFSLSVRPIVAATEEGAWRRAEDIRSATARRVAGAKTAQVQGIQVPARSDPQASGGRLFGFRESSSVGSERLQQQGAEATSMMSGCGTA